MLRTLPVRATRCARGERACRPSSGCTYRGPAQREGAASSSFRESSRQEPCGESRNSPQERESDGELGAAALHIRGADRSAVRLGDRLRDREAEAGSVALGVIAAVEALEETRLRTLRQP